MVLKALSMDCGVVPYLEEINTKFGTTMFSKYLHYRMLWSRVPKRNRRVPWFKTSISKVDKTKLEPIMDYYNVGPKQALEYFEILSKKQKTYLNKLYKDKQ